MYERLTVATSDSINRDFTRFTPGALISAVWDRALVGIPSFMSHDILRYLGWSFPFGVHFEPGLTRLVSMWLMPETDEESEAFDQRLQAYLQHELYENHREDLERLSALVSRHLRGAQKAALVPAVALIEDGLAVRACPDVFARADKDGLVPSAALSPIAPGVYQVGDLLVFAHQYFRRSLYRLNTPNAPFLSQLQRIATEAADRITARIALDRDMVGLASTHREYIEHQYWWGPKFSGELTSIPTGVTRHEADEDERLYHGISRTEFWWQSRDGQHIFEAEELRDIPSAHAAHQEDQQVYGCRYVHSIVQEGTGVIEHFDGSVRAYPEEQMIERLDSHIGEFGRHSMYDKLWRVDGTVTVSEWKQLLSDYFRDNHLVGEYLGGIVEDPFLRYERLEESVKEDSVALRERLVPYSMKAGAGVRIVFSCHRPRAQYPAGRSVLPLDSLKVADTRVPAVETDTTELHKVFKRQGNDISLPEGVAYLYCKDLYSNLPLVFHNLEGTGLAESIRGTLRALLVGQLTRM